MERDGNAGIRPPSFTTTYQKRSETDSTRRMRRYTDCEPGGYAAPRVMTEKAQPDSTAVRVALWRALHVEVDPPPHVLEDELGLELVDPPEDWRSRGDMHPEGTRLFRMSIVMRARFIEDLVAEQIARGVTQYVILGAGLDTFAQRKADIASKLQIFEIDQPQPQEWKKERLGQLGIAVPNSLHFVPVDFEAKESWRQKLAAAGFEESQPAVIASTGVSMYLTLDANRATLGEIASFPAGSTLAMSFMVPLELLDPDERPALEGAMRGARASGTPFISLFTPDEIMALAREAGLKNARVISGHELAKRYASGRQASNGEQLLIATTSS